MKTDEQAAKEYAENMCEYVDEPRAFEGFELKAMAEKDFLAGCRKVRTELRDEIDGYKSAIGDLKAEKELEACIFAEWCSPLHFSAGINKWFYNKQLKTTAELFASPEFLAYYEERKSK